MLSPELGIGASLSFPLAAIDLQNATTLTGRYEVEEAAIRTRSRPLPLIFWIGVALAVFWWAVAWLRLEPVSDIYFFPLWLGFIMAVDGLTRHRTGTSLLSRSGPRAVWLFLLSAPLWWLFEILNRSIQNWQYHPEPDFSHPAGALLASLSFSTVLPAILSATELVRSFRLQPPRWLPAMKLPAGRLLAFHLAGWAMLATMLLWPTYAFPLCWIALFFIIEPVVAMLSGPSVTAYIRRGDWSPVCNLAIATLVCGVFWEMWNYYALPKWTYSVPFVDFAHIFEMPLLGYGGYIPFGLEVFAFYALAVRVLPGVAFPFALVSSRAGSDTR